MQAQTWLGLLSPQPQPDYNRVMPEGYLTVREAAERLNVDESRIKALIKAGKLKAERFGKRMWVIKADDFAEFEANRNTKPGRPCKVER